MRHIKGTISLFLFLLFSHAAWAAPSQSDSSNAADSLIKKNLIRQTQTATTQGTQKDSATSLLTISPAAPCRDSVAAITKELFSSMGKYHTAMGIYNIAAGVLAVVAGAAILEKEDILPFSLSLVTLGGITVGIGIWEIHLGSKLSRIK